jgi:uncharacterized protein (TIGR00251 family)
MFDAGLKVRETGAGLEVRLHVQPRARRSEIAGVFDGALKVKVTAPPVEDAANRAIIDFFSGMLNIPKSSLRILAGAKSRGKTLQIRGVSLLEFRKRLSATQAASEKA